MKTLTVSTVKEASADYLCNWIIKHLKGYHIEGESLFFYEMYDCDRNDLAGLKQVLKYHHRIEGTEDQIDGVCSCAQGSDASSWFGY